MGLDIDEHLPGQDFSPRECFYMLLRARQGEFDHRVPVRVSASPIEPDLRCFFVKSLEESKKVSRGRTSPTEICVKYNNTARSRVWWSPEHNECLGIVIRKMGTKVRMPKDQSAGTEKHGYQGHWLVLLERPHPGPIKDKAIVRTYVLDNAPSMVQIWPTSWTSSPQQASSHLSSHNDLGMYPGPHDGQLAKTFPSNTGVSIPPLDEEEDGFDSDSHLPPAYVSHSTVLTKDSMLSGHGSAIVGTMSSAFDHSAHHGIRGRDPLVRMYSPPKDTSSGALPVYNHQQHEQPMQHQQRQHLLHYQDHHFTQSQRQQFEQPMHQPKFEQSQYSSHLSTHGSQAARQQQPQSRQQYYAHQNSFSSHNLFETSNTELQPHQQIQMQQEKMFAHGQPQKRPLYSQSNLYHEEQFSPQAGSPPPPPPPPFSQQQHQQQSQHRSTMRTQPFADYSLQRREVPDAQFRGQVAPRNTVSNTAAGFAKSNVQQNEREERLNGRQKIEGPQKRHRRSDTGYSDSKEFEYLQAALEDNNEKEETEEGNTSSMDAAMVAFDIFKSVCETFTSDEFARWYRLYSQTIFLPDIARSLKYHMDHDDLRFRKSFMFAPHLEFSDKSPVGLMVYKGTYAAGFVTVDQDDKATNIMDGLVMKGRDSRLYEETQASKMMFLCQHLYFKQMVTDGLLNPRDYWFHNLLRLPTGRCMVLRGHSVVTSGEGLSGEDVRHLHIQDVSDQYPEILALPDLPC